MPLQQQRDVISIQAVYLLCSSSQVDRAHLAQIGPTPRRKTLLKDNMIKSHFPLILKKDRAYLEVQQKQQDDNTLTCWTNQALLHLAEAKLRTVRARRAGQNALNTSTETVMSCGTELDAFSWQTVGASGTGVTHSCTFNLRSILINQRWYIWICNDLKMKLLLCTCGIWICPIWTDYRGRWAHGTVMTVWTNVPCLTVRGHGWHGPSWTVIPYKPGDTQTQIHALAALSYLYTNFPMVG